MYRTGLFLKAVTWVIERGWKDAPWFHADLRCDLRQRRPLRSGKISPEVCGIPARWASGPPSRFLGYAGNSVKTVPGWKPGLYLHFLWKGFQSYHWVSRITFLCKLISKSASQLNPKYAENIRGWRSCWLKYEFLEKWACFQMYFFCGVCEVKHHIYFYCVPFKRLLFSFEICVSSARMH